MLNSSSFLPLRVSGATWARSGCRVQGVRVEAWADMERGTHASASRARTGPVGLAGRLSVNGHGRRWGNGAKRRYQLVSARQTQCTSSAVACLPGQFALASAPRLVSEQDLPDCITMLLHRLSARELGGMVSCRLSRQRLVAPGLSLPACAEQSPPGSDFGLGSGLWSGLRSRVRDSVYTQAAHPVHGAAQRQRVAGGEGAVDDLPQVPGQVER